MTADPKSARLILTWPNGGHNGGCLRFGPGRHTLRFQTGDGSGIADGLQTGQDISDLLGSILRIDVNETDRNKGYSIPDDNPFVKTRWLPAGEVWAYGNRQCWKFSFDTANGDLWAGEVGQDLWDMVLKIEKGGNYGWSIKEGTHPFRPDLQTRPEPDPARRSSNIPTPNSAPSPVASSITANGCPNSKATTSTATTTPAASGFSEYDREAKRLTEHRQLTDTTLRIIAWGQDGDERGYRRHSVFHRWRHLSTRQGTAGSRAESNFPRKLSETGVFESVKDHKPAKGYLIPYSVNSELWSDGAISRNASPPLACLATARSNLKR